MRPARMKAAAKISALSPKLTPTRGLGGAETAALIAAAAKTMMTIRNTSQRCARLLGDWPLRGDDITCPNGFGLV